MLPAAVRVAALGQRLRFFALCALGGLTAALSHWGVSPAVWFSLVPLTLLVYLSASSPARIFFPAFAGSFFFYLFSLYWLFHVSPVGPVLAALYFALYPALVAVGARRVLLRLGDAAAGGFLALAFVAAEDVQGWFLTGFPYIKLAHALDSASALAQLAELGGAAAVSLPVAFVSAALGLAGVFVLSRRRPTTGATVFAVLALAVLIAGQIVGAALFRRTAQRLESPEARCEVRIGLVQGNVLPADRFDASDFQKSLDVYTALTESLEPGTLDLAVWPETAVPLVLRYSQTYYNLADRLTRRLGCDLLLGSTDIDVAEGQERMYNSALLFRAAVGIVDVYDKIHLVPFGEYIPCERFIPYARFWIPVPEILTPGLRPALFSLRTRAGGRALYAPLICFEDVFPELARAAAATGADFFINLTNDGWFGQSSGAYQHLRAARLRAVENRLYLLRAATTGVSCLIDPLGRTVQAVGIDGRLVGVRATAVMQLFLGGRQGGPAFYTRYGDLFARGVQVFVMLLLLWALCRRKSVLKG